MDDQASVFSAETAGTVDPVLACFKCLKGKCAIEEPVVTFCGHLFCWRCLFMELPPERPYRKGFALSCPVCQYGLSGGTPYKDQHSLIPVYKKTETLDDHVDDCMPARPPAIGFSVSDLDEKIKSTRTAVQRLMNAKDNIIAISEQNNRIVDSVEERFKQIMRRL